MADIKWIKITTDIFDNEKIQYIEELPESDTILVIWLKLLAIAGKTNDCGLIYITKDIPYNLGMLKKVLRRKEEIIKLALLTFEKLGMIEIDNDIIAITNWEKHQNVEQMEKLKLQWKDASQRYREKQKQKLLESHNSSYDGHNTDKNRIDKIRNIFIPPTLENVLEYCKERKNNVDAERFVNFYSSKGWMIGKNKMKDWKAAVRTWEKNDNQKQKSDDIIIDTTDNSGWVAPWEKE